MPQWITDFVSSRSFILTIILLVSYFIFSGVLKRFYSLIISVITLVFMVGGTAVASAAKAQSSGGNVSLGAIIGGGFALAIYGAILLVFHKMDKKVVSKSFVEKGDSR